MTPREFLEEEFLNVERVLTETLRHDYSPELSKEYYEECVARLDEVRAAISRIPSSDLQTISAQLNQLGVLASWIFSIERSHLGEFSWPFAQELRRIATLLLAEKDLKGDTLEPIVHVVAAEEGYQIGYESQVPAASGKRRFAIVAFPRSLKHHALLHALFGHELGHTAQSTAETGEVLKKDVLNVLIASGPMSSETSATSWLNDPNAPQEVKSAISRYGKPFNIDASILIAWREELICDLFGLLLFGPSFLAAHKVYLEPIDPNPYDIELENPTHPPRAVRHKMLVQMMRLLDWHLPITNPSDGEFHEAEKGFLQYLVQENYSPWAMVFQDNQLKAAINGLQKIFMPGKKLSYESLDAKTLVALMRKLVGYLPPVIADIDTAGKPGLTRIGISQCLYAGWACWLGRSHLVGHKLPTFLEINQLCNHALLQQLGINEAIKSNIT